MTDPLDDRSSRRGRGQPTWTTGHTWSCAVCLYDDESGARRRYGDVLTIVGGLLLCGHHLNYVAAEENLGPQILGPAVEIAQRAKEASRVAEEKLFEHLRRDKAKDRPEETS